MSQLASDKHDKNQQTNTVVEEKKSLCRICTAQCPIIVGIDSHGRPVSARGDKSNPSSEGFFCNKGKHFPEMHTHPNRFLSSQRRNANGQLEAIGSSQAIQEVCSRYPGNAYILCFEQSETVFGESTIKRLNVTNCCFLGIVGYWRGLRG